MINPLSFLTFPTVMYLTDDSDRRTHLTQIAECCKAGILWIQLRVKQRKESDWFDIASEAVKLCNKHNVLITINDRVDICKAVKADGVHLGRDDMAPQKARALLGDQYHIGVTAHNEEEIAELFKNPVMDYIGIGPYRISATKPELTKALGDSGIRRLVRCIKSYSEKMPIIAIGAIQHHDIKTLLNQGVSALAVGGAIRSEESIVLGVEKFLVKE